MGNTLCRRSTTCNDPIYTIHFEPARHSVVQSRSRQGYRSFALSFSGGMKHPRHRWLTPARNSFRSNMVTLPIQVVSQTKVIDSCPDPRRDFPPSTSPAHLMPKSCRNLLPQSWYTARRCLTGLRRGTMPIRAQSLRVPRTEPVEPGTPICLLKRQPCFHNHTVQTLASLTASRRSGLPSRECQTQSQVPARTLGCSTISIRNRWRQGTRCHHHELTTDCRLGRHPLPQVRWPHRSTSPILPAHKPTTRYSKAAQSLGAMTKPLSKERCVP